MTGCAERPPTSGATLAIAASSAIAAAMAPKAGAEPELRPCTDSEPDSVEVSPPTPGHRRERTVRGGGMLQRDLHVSLSCVSLWWKQLCTGAATGRCVSVSPNDAAVHRHVAALVVSVGSTVV